MWKYCGQVHTLSIAENHHEDPHKLYLPDFRGGATAEEKAAHI
jgi:hypothetical protein